MLNDKHWCFNRSAPRKNIQDTRGLSRKHGSKDDLERHLRIEPVFLLNERSNGHGSCGMHRCGTCALCHRCTRPRVAHVWKAYAGHERVSLGPRP
jgi:hypothetical protein